MIIQRVFYWVFLLIPIATPFTLLHENSQPQDSHLTTSPRKYCGSHLVNVIRYICRSNIYSTGDGKPLEAAEAQHGHYRRRGQSRGVSHECCTVGCTESQLRAYCDDPSQVEFLSTRISPKGQLTVYPTLSSSSIDELEMDIPMNGAMQPWPVTQQGDRDNHDNKGEIQQGNHGHINQQSYAKPNQLAESINEYRVKVLGPQEAKESNWIFPGNCGCNVGGMTFPDSREEIPVVKLSRIAPSTDDVATSANDLISLIV